MTSALPRPDRTAEDTAASSLRGAMSMRRRAADQQRARSIRRAVRRAVQQQRTAAARMAAQLAEVVGGRSGWCSRIALVRGPLWGPGAV